jgi:hypothetical protein
MDWDEKIDYVIDVTRCRERVAKRALKKSRGNILIAVWRIFHNFWD